MEAKEKRERKKRWEGAENKENSIEESYNNKRKQLGKQTKWRMRGKWEGESFGK